MPSKAEAIQNNAQFKNFIEILKENKANEQFKAIIELINHADAMERKVDKLLNKNHNMEKEIAALKDEAAKSVLTKICDDVKSSINETIEKLGKFKDTILDGIKNALTAVKNTGLSALNSVMKFFKVKDSLNALRGSVDKTIYKAENAVENIDKAFKNMHSAASNQRNVFRSLAGKEAKDDIKPNGKIAAAIKTPHKATAKIMKGIRKIIDKATASLDNLDKKVTHNRKIAVKAKKAKAAKKEKKKEIKSQAKTVKNKEVTPKPENPLKKEPPRKSSLLKKVDDNKKIIEVKQTENKDKTKEKSSKKKNQNEL